MVKGGGGGVKGRNKPKKNLSPSSFLSKHMASFLNRCPHKQSKEEEKLKGGEREKEKKRKEESTKPKTNIQLIFFQSNGVGNEKGNKMVKEIAYPGGLF